MKEVWYIKGEHLMPMNAGDEKLSYWGWFREAGNPCITVWMPVIGMLFEYPFVDGCFSLYSWVVNSKVIADIMVNSQDSIFTFSNEKDIVKDEDLPF